jgi:hypothetical protein
MAATKELSASLKQLRAMIGDLHDNRVTLDDLAIRCSMFRFTGGTMSLAAWQINGLTPYLLIGSTMGGRIAPEDVVRYLALLEKLTESQRDFATATRPRTLRMRRAITDALEQTLHEAQLLGTDLEVSIEKDLDSSEAVAS